MQRAHKIALDPTPAQEAYFRCACGTSRFTWNWALAEWMRQALLGLKPNGRELKKQFNAIRTEQFPWSREVLRDATARPFDNLQKAFARFFAKRSKRPRFKKKGTHDSFYIANDQFSISGKSIKIPHLGAVKMRESLRFGGKIISAVVSRTASRWYVSIAVEIQDPPKTCENQAVVGVDLGIKTLATLSDGSRFEAPKPLARDLERLRRLCRKVSKKKKGSKNREKAKMKLSRLHARIASVRKDALHKLTTLLVRQYGTVVIEDLNVTGMRSNRHLSRAISDLGFYEFRRQLTYKAETAGVIVVVADRWYPSSKLCADCGARFENLLLSDREWICESCGTTRDRDLNAARNLQQLGQAMPEVTPVEMGALARLHGLAKLPSRKQELTGMHFCVPRK